VYTLGTQNSAFGAYALSGASGSRADGNTAVGFSSMFAVTGADQNTALGAYSLYAVTNGELNTAVGNNSLATDSTGIGNTALGYYALSANVAGGYNIAIGYLAGLNTTASYNVDIANEGIATETGVIRIGTAGTQKAAFIAGIETSKVTGSAVYVTSTGRLGVLASSERYKTEIAPMGGQSDRLAQLRPITFHLKSEPNGSVQYGLIAEEVANVYPELVTRGSDGAIEGVRYDELAPMLVNELQKQRRRMAAQKTELRAVEAELASQSAQLATTSKQLAELDDLRKELQATVHELHRKDEVLAQR
jgi:hypothetical protein